ncbi:N-acetylmuramidase [Endozoicomonas gorgoniicola]|uniref:N-acetylmuramidase n=1 Tax=Endozoicomonas gorgoniicola TaxID=1234144 RepID=A0ABT3MT74_9GAMM|nr:N-acetylmuramidase [Endozoicomonas gorgoniicola]MCW7552572.1 N-acetylmuramidase [Endozoicomonas gorgoniicola]
MNASTYSSAFETAIAFVLSEEGGYVNDPNDNGGETNYGISKRAYPDLDIKNLTVGQAEAIYYQDYWLKCCCNELPVAVACVVLDTAVNMGPRTAIRFLQQSLRLKVDGLMGPQTLRHAHHNPPLSYLSDYLSRRARRYFDIAQTDSQRRFYRGWLKRTYELQQYLYEERLL